MENKDKNCESTQMVNCDEKFVTWKVFIWAIALITLATGLFFGWMLTAKAQTDSEVKELSVKYYDVAKELSNLSTIIDERIPAKK